MEYSEGNATGTVIQDYVYFDEDADSGASIQFLSVTKVAQLERQNADGIMGLGETADEDCKLIIDEMIDQDILQKSRFTMFIGKDGVDDSFIEFGQKEGKFYI